ncbi:MAG: hypothetical protein WCJ60_04070 [bacterium]
MNPKRLFSLMLAVLSLATVASIGGFLFADKQLSSSSKSVSLLKAEHDYQTDKINSLRSSNIAVPDSQGLNDLINSLLPRQKKQENLVADIIYTATTQSGIKPNQIVNISFSSSGIPDSLSGTSVSKDIKGVYVYPFTLQLKDISYQTMLKLFQELEKNKRIIQADQVAISPDKARAGYLSSVSLSLKTFVQP